MNLKSILGGLLLGSALTICAQDGAIPLRILSGNEATAIPFDTFWSNPEHPSFQVGTEFRYNDNTHHYLYQTLNLGYVYHENLYQGAYINSELGYDYRLNFGLNLKTLLGVGYLHMFSTNEEYRFEDGQYTMERDRGNSRLMPSLALGLGFRTNKNNPRSPELMLLYKSWVEFPYSPGFIPIMAHTELNIGLKLYIN